ncbi:MAG TPA: L-threonylcarbamoyladenylate synthase [Opitutaceae bacterium]
MTARSRPDLQTRTFRGTPRNLSRLSQALTRGELVAVPTETVYGLAGDALDVRACRAIFRAKGRPTSDPLIVHIHHLRQLDELAVVNEAALALAKAFWPGPLTIILPKQPIVPDLATAGLPSVAIRMPRHPLFRALLRQSGRPLAAPSANPFGYVSPTSAAHVRAGLGGRIRYILDGGPCRIGLESTIIDLRDPARPEILRPGAIGHAELARVLKRPVQERQRTVSAGHAAVAPGLLTRHYSPRTPVVLHERLESALAADAEMAAEAFVFLARPAKRTGPNVFWLDDRGRLAPAARRLFDLLQRLDTGKWRRIHMELASGEDGLAVAINDRLRRAAAKR